MTTQHPSIDTQSNPKTSSNIDLTQLDNFIQSSLDKFFFVEPWDELYKNTENYSKHIISNKSTIPDLIIFNKTFNKNDCFEGAKEEIFRKFPRVRFILRAKARKEYNPKDTFVTSTTEVTKTFKAPTSLKELLEEEEINKHKQIKDAKTKDILDLNNERIGNDIIDNNNNDKDNSFDFNAFNFGKRIPSFNQNSLLLQQQNSSSNNSIFNTLHNNVNTNSKHISNNNSTISNINSGGSNKMTIPPQMKMHSSSYKTTTTNYNEDEEEDPEWGDDDVTDFKKSKVSFREIPTELKESAEQHLLNAIPPTVTETISKQNVNVQKENKVQTPEIKFEQKEQVFTNNDDQGSNLFEQIESYLLQTEEKEKEQIKNLNKQKQLQQQQQQQQQLHQLQHHNIPHHQQQPQAQTQIFSSEDFFDKLASSSQSTSNSNNQFPSSLYSNQNMNNKSQQNNIYLSQEYQKKKKQLFQNQDQQQQLPLNIQNSQYMQSNNMLFQQMPPNQNMNMNVNMNFNNNTPSPNQFPFQFYNNNNSLNQQHFNMQQQNQSLHQMQQQQLSQMPHPQTPQQLQFLYQLQQNQLHQLYINHQRRLQKQHQRQLNQLFPAMKQTPQLMYNNSQGNNAQYNMRSPLVNMNMNMNMNITLPQTSHEPQHEDHQVNANSDDDDDDDPLMNDFETNYTAYNPTVFLENPALIVKKNLIEAHWFLMKDNKILGNYNSEELLFFLGEKIKDGEKFENVWISDYPTDLVFQPKNLYDILKDKVPSLKKKYMKSKMGLNKKKNKTNIY